jgi:hypothetical protein
MIERRDIMYLGIAMAITFTAIMMYKIYKDH